MSRLGKMPILLKEGVEIKKDQNKVLVKGPKGDESIDLPSGIDFRIENGAVIVVLSEGSKLPTSKLGLYRSLIANMMMGVTLGFEKQLSLIGVGYRAAVKGNILDLSIGFSHPCQLKIPSDLTVVVEKSTLIKISGINKQQVGQFAADVRSVRPPEPYKGKGVRYVGEYVRKKAGKAAKGK